MALHWRPHAEQGIIRAVRPWRSRPEKSLISSLPRMTRRMYSITALVFGFFLSSFLDAMIPSASSATDPAPPISARQPGKASSPHIGAAMTVLATLEQAQVLPPEGTKAADRIIQSVIQLQSLFTASTNPAVREFLHRAVERRGHDDTASTLARFRSSGWTSDVLEALAHAAQAASPEELHALGTGLQSVNLSVEDFRQFMRLVTDGEQALASTGRSFHEVFAFHRQTMPGGHER